MAVSDELPPNIESMLQREAGVSTDLEQVKTRAIYQVYPGSRAPVSKRYGMLWKERRDSAIKAREDLSNAWDEAIRYYNNDQLEHRDQRTGRSGNSRLSKRRNHMWSETENVIFSGINAMLPAVYAKNPDTEFTAYQTADKPVATMHERLMDALIAMRSAPGINAKIKLKQLVVQTSLTNAGWVEIGYQQFEDSNEAVIAALNDVGDKLSKAKTEEQVQQLEGDLEALEEKFAIARPSGPIMRVRSPHDVVVDPHSIEPDHSDARWMMVCDMLPTPFVVSRYGVVKDKDGEVLVKSLYKPTHVLPISTGNSVDDNTSIVNNFKLLNNDGMRPGDYGYATKEDFDAAVMTKVWYVWDRATRRVFMYHDDDWTWPLWVWDDPYHLPRFFPLFKMSFLLPPVGAHGKGETTYVLDQQDAINEINDEWRRARQRVKMNVFFKKDTITPQDVESVLKGDDGTARGVQVPDGAKLEDLFYTPTPNVVQFRDLFDTAPKLASIDRIYGINEVLRGAQFKTNTTNQAINTYNSVSSMRLDEKIDTIEDFVGEVMHNIMMLCVQFMKIDQVATIIGEENAQLWENMSPTDYMLRFNMRVVGGSTQKPTSGNKKQEALQVGQVLGQFANATPKALVIFLRALENAFDSINIKEEDWQEIRESIDQLMQAQMQKASGAPPGGGGTGVQRGTPPGPGAQTPGSGGDMLQTIAQALDSMPPQVRAALGQVLAEGVSASEALPAIIRQLQAGANGAQAPTMQQ